MDEQLRVLFVASSDDDVAPLLRALQQAGSGLRSRRVGSAAELLQALDEPTWDAVVARYETRAFGGLEACARVRDKTPKLPFILVGGPIGEERVAQAIRLGADDYVREDNLARLAPAIRQEIEEAERHRQQHAAFEALRERELQLSSVYNAISDVVFQVNPEADGHYRFVSINARFLMVTGLAYDQVVGKRVDEVIPSPSIDLVLEKYEEAIRRRTAVHWEETSDYPTGRLTGEVTVVPVFDGAGQCLYLVGAVHDITAHKRAEEQLAASQRILQTVFDSLPLNLVVKDRGHRYLMVNQAWCEFHTIPAKDALGKHTLELPTRPENDKRRAYEEDCEVLASGQQRVFLRTVTAGNGEQRNIQVIRSPLRDPGGELTGLVNITVDLTKQVQAHHRTDVAYARLQDAIESLPAAFMLFDAQERLVVWNSRVREFYPDLFNQLHPGLLNADVLRSEAEYAANEGFAYTLLARDWDANGTGDPIDTEMQRHDGRWVQMVNRRTSEGGIVALRFDVSEMREREEELRQAQKMETLGKLTGGVAHDFNNLLQVISGYTALSKALLDPHGEPFRNLTLVDEAAQRAASLTQQLLAFSRRQVLKTEALDLTEVIARHLTMLRRMVPEPIELQQGLTPNLPTVRADRGMIEQVLMNLVINARDAMPRGGWISVATTRSQLTWEDCKRAPWAIAGPYVTIACTDTGAGIAPAVLERIFEPFFTTKEQGKGTGLGLSTVYGIVQQHRGVISVETELGKGTTFQVHLPVHEGAPHRVAETDRLSLPQAQGTILVAEDSDALRELTRRVLEDEGYRVLTSVDGQDAVSVFSAQADAIDVVLLDMIMPKLNGMEVYRHVQRVRPGTPAIFSSGWYDTEEEEAAKAAGVRLLYKPHPPWLLLRTIKEVLGERARR